MKLIPCIIAFFCASFGSVSAQVDIKNIERIFAEELADSHAIHFFDGQRNFPQHVLRIAAERGASRSEVQALLFQMAENSIEKLIKEGDRSQRTIANGALSVLAHIADQSMIDRLVQVAGNAPDGVQFGAVSAAIYTASREAPHKLAGVANRITENSPDIEIVPALGAIMNYSGFDGRLNQEDLIYYIIKIVKVRFMGENREDKIYADGLLEKYDPEFHRSEGRRRILTELTRSENPTVSLYAAAKLAEAFHQIVGPEAVSIVEETKDGHGAHFNSGGTSGDSVPQVLSQDRFYSRYLLVGGVVALVLLTLALWKMTR